MIKIFKIGLLAIIFANFQLNYCSQDQQNQMAEIESEQDAIEFIPKSNERYIYKKIMNFIPLDDQIIEPSTEIKIAYNQFNSGIMRTKTTIKIINDEIVTTTETWITAHPSYVTKKNAAIALGVAGFGLATYAYQDQLKNLYNSIYPEQNVIEDIDNISIYPEQNVIKDIDNITSSKLAPADAIKLQDIATKIVYGENIKHLQALKDAGVDMNAQDSDGDTILKAAAGKSPEYLLKVIELGANNVNTCNNSGYAALASAESPENIKILCDLGANVNKQANDGTTPLMLASISRNTKTARALIECGADLNIKDNQGRTALSIAESRGDYDMTQMLKKAGATGSKKWW